MGHKFLYSLNKKPTSRYNLSFNSNGFEINYKSYPHHIQNLIPNHSPGKTSDAQTREMNNGSGVILHIRLKIVAFSLTEKEK